MIKCSECGKENDSMTNISDESLKPQAGDLSICIGCGHLSIICEDLSLREPTDEEILDLAGNLELVSTMNAIADYHKWKKKQETK